MRITRWMLPLCTPLLLLALGGCPTDITSTLTDSATAAATAVLEQVAAGDVPAPPSTTDISDLTGTLGLADNQAQQAQAIYQALNGDYSNLRSAAVKDIRSALTAAQQKLLDQVAGDILDQAGASDQQQAAVQPMIDLLASRLGLTTDQQGQIASTRASLRGVVEQLRAKARAAFVELLTDAQKSVLKQIGGI